MSDFVDGRELSRKLIEVLRNAKMARLAVAFWGQGAADALGIRDGASAEFQIVCNLMSGGTNPHEIRILLERGIDVRQLNDLHAKLGVIDDLSFLGSSNMSTNGLGAEGAEAGWREANVVFDRARPEIVNMFEKFWAEATKIKKNDLAAAEKAWAIRRRGGAAAAVRGLSLVQVLRTAPKELDALNVRMVVYDAITEEDDLKVLRDGERDARKKHGDRFDVYWDWDILTEEAQDAYLVDFNWLAKGNDIENGGLYRRKTDEYPDFKRDGQIFHPAYKIKRIEGMTFGNADKEVIRSAFRSYIRNRHTAKGDDTTRSYNFPISELSEYLPPVG